MDRFMPGQKVFPPNPHPVPKGKTDRKNPSGASKMSVGEMINRNGKRVTIKRSQI